MTAAGAGAATLAPAYDVGLVTVGLMTTALATPYALLQLPSGALVDRIGVRNASVLGLLVVVLAHVAACTTPTTWVALVARTLSGAGFAVCFVSGAELARRSGAGPSGIGFFGGVALGASGVAVAVVPLAEPLLDWRSAWATTGVVAVVALLCVALVDLPERGPEAPRPAAAGTGRRLVADGELHRLGSVHAVTLGIGVVLSNWAALVLVETWGFGRPAAAGVASLVLGCSVLSRPLGGVVARRFPRRVAAVAMVSLPVCAAATLALAFRTTPVVAVAAVLAVGVFSGLPFATVISAVQARRPDRPAAAVGMVNSQANTLILAGTPLLGAAIAADHTTAALVVVAALWTLPLVSWPRTMARRVVGGAAASRPVEVVAD
jgi:predicted MFS family arabinose efflux permease